MTPNHSGLMILINKIYFNVFLDLRYLTLSQIEGEAENSPPLLPEKILKNLIASSKASWNFLLKPHSSRGPTPSLIPIYSYLTLYRFEPLCLN